MKKIISIHLAGKVYQMEEDAYLYLNSALSGQWKKQELEAQVAGCLDQKPDAAKTVITYGDAVDALRQLGFSAPESGAFSADALRRKRLCRQPENKLIAGVCTGLGEYLEIDPVILRVLFAVTLFMFSVGFWLYVILWIIVPKRPVTLNT